MQKDEDGHASYLVGPTDPVLTFTLYSVGQNS